MLGSYLNNKLNGSGKSNISKFAMPDFALGDYLEISATGTQYTMPFNGYVNILTKASEVNSGWVSLDIIGNQCTIGLDIDRTGIGKIFIPIMQGVKFTITYGGTTLEYIRCIRAYSA